MTLPLHELLPVPHASNPSELFIAPCTPHHRRAKLREWLGHDYHPDPHGRPLPASPSNRSLSISHTPALLALAIRNHGRIGIDLETLPGPADLNPLPQGLTPAEQQHLLALNPADLPLAFSRLWTAKEALSKALGLGNTLDLAQLEIRLDHASTHFLALYQKPQLAQGWTVIHRHLLFPAPTLLTLAFDPLPSPA
jgi:phosphopantetheinyl transferase